MDPGLRRDDRQMLAPAKINLDLRIIGRRVDGFHALQSLVVFADVGDDVSVSTGEGLTLEVKGAFAAALPQDKDKNLVLKAAKWLAQSAGIAANAHIILHKNLPIGAGLGGGSSDAATALLWLSKRWNCDIPSPHMLGSDISACLQQSALWMEGVGERITPLTLAFDIPMVLVNPGAEVLAGDVYKTFTEAFFEEKLLPAHFADLQALCSYLRSSANMLTTPAQRIAPVIGDALEAIASTQNCLLSRMSGSGSTCFGLYESWAQAQLAAESLAKLQPSWWITPTLSRGTHGETQ